MSFVAKLHHQSEAAYSGRTGVRKGSVACLLESHRTRRGILQYGG